MEFIEELNKYFYPWAAFVIIIFGFFIKSFIEFLINKKIEIKKAELNQDIENFKQQLQHGSDIHKLEIDKNLEEYRSQLEIIRLKNQVIFSQLHEKRGIVLESLYKKLIRFDSLLYTLTIPIKYGSSLEDVEMERKINTAHTSGAFDDFNKYYNENRIYFSNKTCSLLDKLRNDFKMHLIDYSEKDILKTMGAEGLELAQATVKAAKVWDKVKNEIPPAMRSLEDEFRRILGVTDEKVE